MLKQLCQKIITPIIKQRILKIFSTEIKKEEEKKIKHEYQYHIQKTYHTRSVKYWNITI